MWARTTRFVMHCNPSIAILHDRCSHVAPGRSVGVSLLIATLDVVRVELGSKAHPHPGVVLIYSARHHWLSADSKSQDGTRW